MGVHGVTGWIWVKEAEEPQQLSPNQNKSRKEDAVGLSFFTVQIQIRLIYLVCFNIDLVVHNTGCM